MVNATKNLLTQTADTLGVSPEDLLRQSLLYYFKGKVRELSAELAVLKKQYGVATIEEFEELYKASKIEEAGTWRDYQHFDNISFKLEQLEDLLSNSQEDKRQL